MRIREIPARNGASVYVVDDAPSLTLLYTVLLQRAGYRVRSFNDRGAALAALNAEMKKPRLLITDYYGLTMPVELFMDRCLAIHPALRILMVSGFSEMDLQFSRVRPHRFIRKPFAPEEFRAQVRLALAPVEPADDPQLSGRHPWRFAVSAESIPAFKKGNSS